MGAWNATRNRSWLAMVGDRSNRSLDRRSTLKRALRIIEALDRQKHLPTGLAVLCFFVAFGLSIQVFFFLVDLPLWRGGNEFFARAVVSISWALIFPVWAAIFAGLILFLRYCGLDDLYAATRSQLSRLFRTPGELKKLRRIVNAQELRHRRLFERAIEDLRRYLDVVQIGNS